MRLPFWKLVYEKAPEVEAGKGALLPCVVVICSELQCVAGKDAVPSDKLQFWQIAQAS